MVCGRVCPNLHIYISTHTVTPTQYIATVKQRKQIFRISTHFRTNAYSWKTTSDLCTGLSAPVTNKRPKRQTRQAIPIAAVSTIGSHHRSIATAPITPRLTIRTPGIVLDCFKTGALSLCCIPPSQHHPSCHRSHSQWPTGERASPRMFPALQT